MGRHGPKDFSVELCGGTHVNALGDIGLFKIVSEGAVASGVRRIEALTGEAARLYMQEQENRLRAAAGALKTAPGDVADRVVQLLEERKRLERELADAKKKLAMGGGSGGAQPTEEVNGVKFLGQVVEGLDPKGLRDAANDARQQIGSGVIALVSSFEGKASIIVGVTDDLADKLDAAALVRAGVEAVGGKGGGGRGGMAQGGGPEGGNAGKAVDAVRAALAGELAEAA